MKLTLNRLFCYLFGGLWAFIILWNIGVPERRFSENENRYLAEKPEFRYEALLNGEYMNGLDSYVNDQFIMRDTWIGIQTRLELALLKQDINSVYISKDGYLIEKHENILDQVQVRKNKERLIEFILKNREILGEDRVTAMLVPTASEVLSDKVPPFAFGFDQAGLLEEMKEAMGDSFIDVREGLSNHKDEYIYYKTDHHWTALGAYYGYRAWAEKVGIAPLKRGDFDIELVTDEFYGTIYSKVNKKMEGDNIYLYHSKEERNYHLVYDKMDISDSLYDYAQLEGKDKYSVYLGGNHGLVEINANIDNGRKLLVIKDSFSHSFVPFISNHYEETHMLDFRYFNGSVASYIQESGITDILVLYNTMGFVKDSYSIQFSR